MMPLKYVPRKLEAVRTMRDGRQICSNTAAGKREYKSRLLEMLSRQESLCCLCGGYLHACDAVFEHEHGRGLNGGHREDRIEIDGRWVNGASHFLCNGQKASVRGNYNETRNSEVRL
jgi:hypothetical protein